MTQITGGELLARVLHSAGVERVFGLEGTHIDPFLFAAQRLGMALLDVRHEAVAGYAADGYFRATGKLAVCAVTAGPGFTNALSALTSAWLDGVPVLFVTGAAPLAQAESNVLQGGFDQVAMARPVTKWAGQATSPQTIVPLVRAALRAALTGRPGPVLLEVPMDVMFEQVRELPPEVALPVDLAPPPAPSPAQIKRLTLLLANARRPAILAGTGALYARCSQELAEFVEHTQIPVFANWKALGVLPASHPMACGSFADLANSSLEPDVLVLLGARQGLMTGGSGHRLLPADSLLIQVDVSAEEIGRIHPVELGLVADCRETLVALNHAMREAGGVTWPDHTQWLAAARRSDAWHRQRYGHVLHENDDQPLHPYRVAQAIAGLVDDNTVLVQDGGDTGGWAETCLSRRAAGPGKYFGLGYLGNLGMFQGFAIGAQVAFPDHRVICLTGDGSAGFQLQEFDTMVRHGLPIVTVVFNNRVWGMNYQIQAHSGQQRAWVELQSNLRYDLVCQACGGHGELVSKPDKLVPALTRAIESGKPACVNVICRPEISPKTEAMLAARGVAANPSPSHNRQQQ